MKLLRRVAECVECKMPSENLAKVFGPTIVGYSDCDPDPNYMYQQTMNQFAVMITNIITCNALFKKKYLTVDDISGDGTFVGTVF